MESKEGFKLDLWFVLVGSDESEGWSPTFDRVQEIDGWNLREMDDVDERVISVHVQVILYFQNKVFSVISVSPFAVIEVFQLELVGIPK